MAKTIKNNKLCQRLIVGLLCFSLAFGNGTLAIAQIVYPASTPASANLPVLSPVGSTFTPMMLKGIILNPDNPLKFDFVIDTGSLPYDDKLIKEEATDLVKYFLAALTVPEKEQWVNLSPFEKNRIIPESFGQTTMGQALLGQDYLLKQISSSLLHPDFELGEKYWHQVFAKYQELGGKMDRPVNSINKIWIVPDRAVIYEQGSGAFVSENHLKVMLKDDYVSLRKSKNDHVVMADDKSDGAITEETNKIYRETILPALEREINEGKTFAKLRQIYNSMLLATWFKRNLKESLLGAVYVDKNLIKGVDAEDKNYDEKIYTQYIDELNKGAFNFIKEEYNPATQELIPRQYFSGGAEGYEHVDISSRSSSSDRDQAMKGNDLTITVELKGSVPRNRSDSAMVSFPDDDTKTLSRNNQIVTFKELRDKDNGWVVTELLFSSNGIKGLNKQRPDGEVVKNDSVSYGIGGRTPNYVYVFKKEGAQSPGDDEIYMGREDVKTVYPEEYFPVLHTKFNRMMESKNAQIAAYQAKLADIKKLRPILGSVSSASGIKVEDFLNDGEIQRDRVGDPVYETIDSLYSSYEKLWTEQHPKDGNVISLDRFLRAWNGFNAGLARLRRLADTKGQLVKVLTNEHIVKVITLVDQLNSGQRSDTFWNDARYLHTMYFQILAQQVRFMMERLEHGRSRSVSTHPDDRVKSSYFHALKLVANDMVSRFSTGNPTFLSVDANNGQLRKVLAKVAPHLQQIVDMELDWQKVDETSRTQSLVVQGDITVLDPTTNRPIITHAPEQVQSYLDQTDQRQTFNTTFQAVTMIDVFNKLRPKEVRSALKALETMLAESNQDANLAPVVYIALPENSSLHHTPFEKSLISLGYTPLVQAEGVWFKLTEDAKSILIDLLADQIQREDSVSLNQAKNTANERINRLERFIRKPFQYGIYAKTARATMDQIDAIPEENIQITKSSMLRGIPTGAENELFKNVDWEQMLENSLIYDLQLDDITPNPFSAIITRKRLEQSNLYNNFNANLDTLSWLVEKTEFLKALEQMNHANTSEFQRAVEVLRLWDEERVDYLREEDVTLINDKLSSMTLTREQLQQIIPQTVSKPTINDINTQSTGLLQITSFIVPAFYQAIQELSSNEGDITLSTALQAWTRALQIIRDPAMLSQEDKKILLEQLKQAVRLLMKKGQFPDLEGLLDSQGVSLRQRSNTQQEWLNALGSPLSTMIPTLEVEVMRDEIKSIVEKIKAENHPAYFKTVESRLMKELAYFANWHTRFADGKVIEEGQGLRDWANQTNTDLNSLGVIFLEEKNKIVIPLEDMDLEVKDAFEQVVNSGFLPDIKSVAEALSEKYPIFQQWIEQQAQTGATFNSKAAALRKWYSQQESGTRLNEKFDFYLPSASEINWETEKSRKSSIVERKTLGSDQKYQEFEARLTAIIWFVENFSEKEMERLLKVAKTLNNQKTTPFKVTDKEVLFKDLKKNVRSIRYVWDTLVASYLTEEQISLIFQITELFYPVREIVPIMNSHEDLSQSLVGKMGFNKFKKGGQSIMDIFRLYFLGNAIEKKRSPQKTSTFDHLRNPKLMLIIYLSLLVNEKNLSDKLESSETLPVGGRTIRRLMSIIPSPIQISNKPFTFDSVSGYLNMKFGLPISALALEGFFQGDFVQNYGLKPEFFGISSQTNINKLKKELADSLKNFVQAEQGDGLIPTIDRAAEIAAVHIEQFRDWLLTEEAAGRTKESPAQGFVEWYSTRLTDEDTPILEAGIFIPQSRQLDWEADKGKKNKGKAKKIVERRELGSNAMYKNFELKLTTLFWLADHFTDAERERLLSTATNAEELSSRTKHFISNFRYSTAELRYLWDTMNVSYLNQLQVDAVLELTKLEFDVDKYNRSAKDVAKTTSDSSFAAVFMTKIGGNKPKVSASASLLTLYTNFTEERRLYQAKQKEKWWGPVDDQLRAKTQRRLSRIQHMAVLLDPQSETQGKIIPGGTFSAIRKFIGISSTSSAVLGLVNLDHFSFHNIAQNLTSMGDKVSAEALKTWFESEEVESLGVTAGSLGIIDAVSLADEVGGIDLNPDVLDLNIIPDRNGVPVVSYKQNFQRIEVDGFIPVIVNVAPINKSLPLAPR